MIPTAVPRGVKGKHHQANPSMSSISWQPGAKDLKIKSGRQATKNRRTPLGDKTMGRMEKLSCQSAKKKHRFAVCMNSYVEDIPLGGNASSNVWILGPLIWNHSCFGISQCAGNAASRLVVKPHCTTYAYATSGLGNQATGPVLDHSHVSSECTSLFSILSSVPAAWCSSAADSHPPSPFPSRLYSYNDPAVWFAFFSVVRRPSSPLPSFGGILASAFRHSNPFCEEL
ncbi:hypothetical protein F4818DRAFT_251862 [Hypoxylon cercidicola]|nr:hypothetical protein F4818DRAFT_251862 [Hypoxylon cercidicola]